MGQNENPIADEIFRFNSVGDSHVASFSIHGLPILGLNEVETFSKEFQMEC